MPFDFNSFGTNKQVNNTPSKGSFDFNSFGNNQTSNTIPAPKQNPPGVLSSVMKGFGNTVSGIVEHPVDTARGIAGGLFKAPQPIGQSIATYGGAGLNVLYDKITGQPIQPSYKQYVDTLREGYTEKQKTTPMLGQIISGNKEDVSNAPDLSTGKGWAQLGGSVAETAFNIYTGGKGGIAKSLAKDVLENVAKNVVKKTGTNALKNIGKAGVLGGVYGITSNLQNEEPTNLDTLKRDIGQGFGGGLAFGTVVEGGSKVAGKVTNPIINKYTEKGKNAVVDEKIRNIYKNVTGDATQIEEGAYRTKKALDLLNKESSNFTVPDTNASLGSNKTKPFNIKSATPNEFISVVNQLGNKIGQVGKDTAKKASDSGLKIDTTESHNIIDNAIKNGEISQNTATRLSQQIASLEQDPLKVHNWVEDVNNKYGKRYEKGTIQDTALSNVADNIARSLRKQLDTVVDRKGYAEAYRNNQTLKKTLLGIAKKANKDFNFGSLATDSAIDSAFALLTGNPVYLARTFASSGFKALQNYNSGKGVFNALKDVTGKMGKGEGKLPSTELKKSVPAPLLQLPEPSKFNMGGKDAIGNKIDLYGNKTPVPGEINVTTAKIPTKPQLLLPKPKDNIRSVINNNNTINLNPSERDLTIGKGKYGGLKK